MPAGSDLDKNLLSKSSLSSYPILELESGEFLNDSLAIANFIAKIGHNSEILGSGASQQAQVDFWMQFMRLQVLPLVKAISLMAFGHKKCESLDDHTALSNEFKELAKTLNNSLKNKQNMVGNKLTICDIYICLVLAEMQ